MALSAGKRPALDSLATAPMNASPPTTVKMIVIPIPISPKIVITIATVVQVLSLEVGSIF